MEFPHVFVMVQLRNNNNNANSTGCPGDTAGMYCVARCPWFVCTSIRWRNVISVNDGGCPQWQTYLHCSTRCTCMLYVISLKLTQTELYSGLVVHLSEFKHISDISRYFNPFRTGFLPPANHFAPDWKPLVGPLLIWSSPVTSTLTRSNEFKNKFMPCILK